MKSARIRLVWNWLRSMRLAIGLFILIAVASLLGALVVQQASDDVYPGRYGTFWGHVILFLGLDDLFHSLWYEALLFLLSINILFCALSRLKRAVEAGLGVSFRDGPGLRDLKVFRELDWHASVDETRAILVQVLRKRLYWTRVKKSSQESGGEVNYRLYAAKGGISCLGPSLVHFSILFVLIGGAWTGVRGYRHNQVLREGEIFTIPGGDFQVRLNAFSIELTGEGKVKQYKSQVAVLEDNEAVLEKSIMVNHPLVHRRIYLYQSGYGRELRELTRAKLSLSDAVGRSPPLIFEAPFGERTPIPDTELKIEIVDFVPDFVLDSRGVVGTRSEEHRNPACRVKLFEGDSLIADGWRFLNYPGVHADREERYHLELLECEPKYYTILQVAKLPGLGFIYGSFVLASIGLCLSFYVYHRRVWAIILPGPEGKAKLLIGGECRRNQPGFEKEFNLIVRALTR